MQPHLCICNSARVQVVRQFLGDRLDDILTYMLETVFLEARPQEIEFPGEWKCGLKLKIFLEWREEVIDGKTFVYVEFSRVHYLSDDGWIVTSGW